MGIDVTKYFQSTDPRNPDPKETAQARPENTQDQIAGLMEKPDPYEKKLDDIEQTNMRFDRRPPDPSEINTPEKQRNYVDNRQAENKYGNTTGMQRTSDLEVNPESLGAEASQRGFIEEAGVSFMKGVGSHVVGGFGDIAQVLGGWTGLSDMYDGNPISRTLQSWGEDIAGQNQVYIPEELKDPSFSIKTLMEPRFWSTHGAEFVPQLMEFILLSKGAGSLVKAGVQAGAKGAVEGGLIKSAKGLAKNMNKKLATGADEVYEIAGSGKGLGKAVTEAGELTKQAGLITENVGAGMASNVLSGMLNAAEAYNTRKEMLDPQGNPLFTKDELADIAGKTFQNNLQWMAVDVLSWSMAYGGGNKILKNSGIYKSGKQAFDKTKNLKNISKGYTAEVSPFLKRIANAAGKGVAEGFEETFQETFESWAAIRAEEEVTGKPSKHKNFWDFYNSKENESTKTIAFALGLLGGGTFGAITHVNKKAERARKLYDRTENLKTVFDAGDQVGKEWQQYHIRETMSDIVLNEKEEHFDTFLQDILGKGIITEDDVTQHQAMFQEYQTLKQQATNLNIRGKYALLLNHSQEAFFQEHMAQKQEELKNNIQIVSQIEGLSDAQKQAKIRKMEKSFDEEIKPIIGGMSQASANKAALILGEPAEAVINIQFSTNEAGGTQVNVGLNNEDYDYYVNESDETILAEQPKSIFKSLIPEKLSARARALFRSNKKSESPEGETPTVESPVEEEATPGETQEQAPSEKKGKQQPPVKKTGEPVTDEEIEELGTLEEEVSQLEDAWGKLQKERKAFAEPKEPYSPAQQKRADQAIKKIDEGLGTIESEIETRKPRLQELQDRASKAKEVGTEEFYDGDTRVTMGAPDNFQKVNPSDKTIHPNVLQQIARKIKSKAKLTPDQQKVYENFQDLVEKTVEGIGGATKQFQAFVNSQQTKDAVKKGKDQAKTAFKQGKAEAMKAAATTKKKIAKAIKDKNVPDIFGKEARETPAVTINREAARAVFTNGQFAVPSIGRIKYGPANLDKMVAVNQRLSEIFKGADRRVTAYILDSLADTIGIEGVGYTIGASVFVQADKWDQGEIFMHEMAHIFFKFGKDMPQTQEFLKIAKANKKLIAYVEEQYPDYILYEYGRDNTGKPFIGRNVGGMTQQEMDQHGVKKLPLDKQSHVLEEVFVHTLQGPLSKKYNNFFAPREEFQRQKSARKWWQLIHVGATKDPNHILETKELLQKLNDNKPFDENNMRDYIVNQFMETVPRLDDNEIGFEARTENFQAVNMERTNEIRTNLEAEQKTFEKSVFEGAEPEVQIDEMLTDEMTEGENEYGENPMIGILEKTFQSRISKATKILDDFVKNYNKAIRLRRVFGKKDLVLFDRKEFKYRMMELAKYSPNSPTFIDALENSPLDDVQAFNKFLEIKAPGQKNVLLNSIWFTMSNQRLVGAVNNALYTDKNGQVQHTTENALNERESTSVQNMMDNMVAARKSLRDDDGSLEGDMWREFLETIDKIKNETATEQDYINAYRFIAGPDIKMGDIWDYGYINVMGRHYSPVTVLKSFFQKDRHLESKGQFAGLVNPYNFKPLLKALAVTNRSFTQDSVVMNAEGNMVPVRITNNHMTKELDRMIASLSPDADGNIMSKDDFLERYSYITKGLFKVTGFKKPVPNQFLENIYDSVVENGVLPDMVYYTGLNDLRDKKATSYDRSTAYEQSFEDLMMFVESAGSKTFLNNMGTFGDSPRKFYMPAPKVPRTNENTTGLYNIYRNIQPNPISRSQFEKEIAREINEEISLINSNGQRMAAISKMAPYFGKDNRLNEKGKKLVSDYAYNVIANGLYMAEVFSPNIPYGDIAKRLKNSSSPVMSVNQNLKFEPVFFQDPQLEGRDATDGGMYILEEDAVRWRNAGLGVFDLNSGFKFLNYSIEKDNPNFKGQTVLLKGYTTVLNEAEIKKNPGLAGIYKLLQDRSAKYKEWHGNTHGGEPSLNFTDGLPNSFPIAIPLSSEKTGIYKRMDKSKVPTLDQLNSDTKAANDYFDSVMYSSGKTKQYTKDNPFQKEEYAGDRINVFSYWENNGKYYAKYPIGTHPKANIGSYAQEISQDIYFENVPQSKPKEEYMGLAGYNFGPQQVMDKQTFKVTVPVQQINSILVNATNLGHLEEAEAIQKLYSDAMEAELDNIVKKLQKEDPQAYKEFLEGQMDKEAMDQVQRFIIENYGIMHPGALNIVTNQLANSIKVAGNKFRTSGTYSHQKSDIGYMLPDGAEINGSKTLNGYQPKQDGSLRRAEIILPGHLKGHVRPRLYYTLDTELGTQTLSFTDKRSTAPKQDVTDYKGKPKTRVMDIATLKVAAQEKAKSEGVSIGEVKRDGQVVGYYVEGETVLATRVPSNGPPMTGVFEAVDFSPGEGNQVIVPTSFTDIIGADLDGDALFIQHKAKGKHAKINEAIDRIAKLWLSPSMAPVIQTRMNTKEAGDQLKGLVKKHFPEAGQDPIPFSPAARRKSYEDSMVAKRNIGTVFNLHRTANVLAAYGATISNGVTIDGDPVYNRFEDKGTGTDSRNHKSALVANLILDNLKEQSADALNLNEYTVSAFSILTNLNVPLEKVALMMNAPMVKEYVNIYNENNSAFHGYTKRAEILDQLSKRPVKGHKGTVKYTSKKGNTLRSIISDPANADFYSTENQSAIIDMIMEMEKVNSEIQAVSKIMAGHSGIETNPYLLEKQINTFQEVMNNSGSNTVLNVPEAMANNPDIKRYLKTAQATLEHTQKINPVYRTAMTQLLTRLSETINNDVLTDNQIKKYTGTIMQFLNSKVAGINFNSKEEISELIKPGSKKNVYTRLASYIQGLKNENKLENNLLLTQGMNMKFSGNSPYISRNTRYFDTSITRQEITRMQREFDNLPYDLKDDLIKYDLLKNGWDSPLSLLPIMGTSINREINQILEDDFKEKGTVEYSDQAMTELERIIVAKDAIGRRNNFIKINAAGLTEGQFAIALQKNPNTREKLLTNKPFYFQSAAKKGGPLKLYRFEGIPKADFSTPFETEAKRLTHLANTARGHITEIKLGNNQELDIELITISDVKKNFRTDPIDPTESFTQEDPDGKEAREEYWEFDSAETLDRETFDITMEFTQYDNETRKASMYERYQREKAKANKIYQEKFAGTDFRDMDPSELLAIYDDYAGKDAYAYAIITTPVIKALAAKVAGEQQQKFNGKKQGGKDISFMKAFLLANNVPSDHPAVAGMVRMMEVGHKKFVAEKVNYLKKINEATDALYKEKFGFDFNRKTPWNIIKRFYYTFFIDRKRLYETLYGNIVEQKEVVRNGRPTIEFKLKDQREINRLKSEGRISENEFNFYTMFRSITGELAPYSVEKNGRKRRDYIPHTSMGFFESFSNRGILGLLQMAKPENEQVYDVKMFVLNPETGEKQLLTFKQIEDLYKAMATDSGNRLGRIKEYAQLRLKAKKLLRVGKNEDGTPIESDPMGIATALNFGIMNRFSNSRSVKAEEMPSMDLNHALSSYVHSTLFVNGNKNFEGFKHMQGVIDGILAHAAGRGHKNIAKYVKINWKDAYMKNKKQVLLGRKGDAVVDLMTKLNLFYQLGFKASYVIGNVAAGKYHNIKNGSPKEWVAGEKRFWGTDKGFNPLEAVKRFKRAQKILKTMNFLDINVYDNVSIASQSRLDNFFGDLALMPMTWSEKWIQGVQFLGMLTEEEWNSFDDNGDYRIGVPQISVQRVTELENAVKNSQGKGYQPTDQRMVQQYSLGRMFMQFSRFIPTMFHDRFAKQDVDIYGKEHVGSLRALYDMVAQVQSMSPKDYIAYRKSLTPELRARLDSGMKGLAMSGLIGAFAIHTQNRLVDNAYWDANYYMDFDKLGFKMKPSAVRTTQNMLESIF